jgi:hypothetical protein
MLRPCAFVCAGWLVVCGNAFGQEVKPDPNAVNPNNDRRQVVPFLDPTYVALARSTRTVPGSNSPVTDWTFEADIVPNFVVHQTFFDTIGEQETERRLGNKRYRFAWSLVAVPMVKLRLFFNEPSAPVRTPSYMPKGTGQVFFFNLLDTHVDLMAFQGTVGHHSNGQDGCLYETQVRPPGNPDADCIPTPPLDRSRVPVNRKDGSFSTNYVVLGARFRRIGLGQPESPQAIVAAQDLLRKEAAGGNAQAMRDAAAKLAGAAEALAGSTKVIDAAYSDLVQKLGTGDRAATEHALDTLLNVTLLSERVSDRDATFGVDLELNPGNGSFLGGGGIDPELKARYGPTRVTFLGGLAWHLPKGCNRVEAKGFAKYIHSPADGVPSWAGSIEGDCLFRETNWGLFARYYTGQDFYNLGFEDNVKRFQFGVTYSQEGFLRFRSKPLPRQLAAGRTAP